MFQVVSVTGISPEILPRHMRRKRSFDLSPVIPAGHRERRDPTTVLTKSR
jgi:hypothetical protein